MIAMNSQQATELVAFVNENDPRFRARVFDLPIGRGSHEIYVLLTDRNTGGNPPLLCEPTDYARHLKQKRYSTDVVSRYELFQNRLLSLQAA